MLHAKAAGAAAAPSATTTVVSWEPLAMWTRRDDKLLEMLVVRDASLQWDIIASRLVDKTPEQASRRYERTVDEVTHALQALQVETPREWDMQIVAASPAVVVPAAAADMTVASAGEEEAAAATEKAGVQMSSAADGEAPELGATTRKRGDKRKKREMWTKEEHILFLEGLEKYGEGKWKTMSNEYLTTKSASQITSHHQKHCKRLEQRKRNGCKRRSIHDITKPTTSTAAVVADGSEPAAGEHGVEPKAPGELVGAVDEAFPGEYGLGTLFT